MELDGTQPIELSLEQLFSIKSFSSQVERMSIEQAKDFLTKLYVQNMVREAMYGQLMKHHWKLGDSPNLEQLG